MSHPHKLYRPTVSDLISLELPLNTSVSPDGSKVAYTVQTADWSTNVYQTFLYVYEVERDRSTKLTQTGNVITAIWLENGSLAVLRVTPEVPLGPQVWVYEDLEGEGVQVTNHRTGVRSFKPFAGGIVYHANDPEKDNKRTRREEHGSFIHFEQEESASTLYFTNIEKKEDNETQLKLEPVIELSRIIDKPLRILSFVCSPLGDAIYLNCQSRDDEIYKFDTSYYRIQVNPNQTLENYLENDGAIDYSGIGKLTPMGLPKGASIVGISPDGEKLLIQHKERDTKIYTQFDQWILDLTQVEDMLEDEALASQMKNITRNIDRETRSFVKWVDEGIFLSYVEGTTLRIVRLSESGDYRVLDFKGRHPLLNFDISKNGYITIIGTSETTIPEIFVSTKPISSPGWELKRVTFFWEKVEDWDYGSVETIRWKSKDGVKIEGILRKPLDFDPSKKYPLLFRLRGGPKSYSSTFLLESDDRRLYPSIQFVHKDILVVKVNHRGSYGYGQEFMDLQRNNLGNGELWDLEGAIDYLDSQGFIDTERVGCMGWSYGGYISAFAGICSTRFRAVSVGAGCTNNYNYYVTREYPQDIAQYHSGSPFNNPEDYLKSAPISGIKQAKTPTLIQHGARDQAVVLYNATELYRGLRDMNVPVELFIYPEMGHMISKPREMKTAMLQNLAWFNHHLLDEKLEFPGSKQKL